MNNSIPPAQLPAPLPAVAPSAMGALPPKLWMWVEGGQTNALDKKVMKDVGEVFGKFKEQLADKLTKEGKAVTADRIKVDINLKTKFVCIQIDAGAIEEMGVDLRSKSENPENKALFDTAKQIEQLLRDHKLLTETIDSLDTNNDMYKYELGYRKGGNGLSKVINRLPVHDVTAEMMKHAKDTDKEKGSLRLCKNLTDSKEERDPGKGSKISEAVKKEMEHQENILDKTIQQLEKQLESRKAALEAGIDDVIAKDAKLLEKQIAEYKAVPRGLLQLSLTLRGIMERIPKKDDADFHDLPESVYKSIIELFENDTQIGVSVVGKDNKAKHVITREHEKLAAIIAAAVVFSHTDAEGDDGLLEYKRDYKFGYQRFLEKHLVNPNTHLGLIGSLLRLQTVSSITSDPSIKNTEMRSLVDTRGMSEPLKAQIEDHLLKVCGISSKTGHHIGDLVTSQPPAAPATKGVVKIDHVFDRMRDDEVEIDANNTIGKLKTEVRVRANPAQVKITADVNGLLGVGEKIKEENKHAKIGYAIAASSLGPWDVHNAHEKSCINSFLQKECKRIEALSLEDQKEEIGFLYQQAEAFYSKNPHKNRGYDKNIVEDFLNNSIAPSIVDPEDEYDQLVKLLFAAYAKDRWGMKELAKGSTDTEAFFGTKAVDYTGQEVRPNVYSRAYSHSLGRNSSDKYIYACVANANGGVGGEKRTLNPKAVDDYNYFKETVKYSLIGQLRLAAERGCTDFVTARLGDELYAGNHRENIKRDFFIILDQALNEKVSVNDKAVPLRNLFDSVTIADVTAFTP